MEAHQAFTVHSRRLHGRQASKEDAARRQASLDGAIPSREEARLLMSLKRDAREAEQQQQHNHQQHRMRSNRAMSDDRTDGTRTDYSEEEEEEEEEEESPDEGNASGSGGKKRSARSAAPRSYSTDSQLSQRRVSRDVSIMKPLPFDRLHDDRDNPLSSLRSCSEFLQGADQTHTLPCALALPSPPPLSPSPRPLLPSQSCLTKSPTLSFRIA